MKANQKQTAFKNLEVGHIFSCPNKTPTQYYLKTGTYNAFRITQGYEPIEYVEFDLESLVILSRF